MTRWLWWLPVVLALALAALAALAAVRALAPPGQSSFSGGGLEGTPGPVASKAPSDRLRVSVVARYEHDAGAFTQGLLWHADRLYETTGHYGRSRIRRWDLETGEIELEARLSPDLFGEGLALVRPRAVLPGAPPEGSEAANELVWLTWKAGRAFRFNLDDFSSLGEFAYEGEGWGLTRCNGELYRSDGTANIWRHDPDTFEVLGRMEASRDGLAVPSLNELECTPRGILANVWQRDEIVQVDSLTGRVTATIDAGGLLRGEERRRAGVLNGIAYRPETDTLLLTGKNWPWLFEVVFEADRAAE